MTVGERIRYYRQKKKLLQRELAALCFFSESAIRNYELGNRTPSPEQLDVIANALEVSYYALADPDLSTRTSVMHTLFHLEEDYLLHPVRSDDGRISLVVENNPRRISLNRDLRAWMNAYDKFQKGEYSKEEYCNWKANYPLQDTEHES